MKDNAGTVDAIRERVDIVELVREYVPALKKAGRTWKACCPFHGEKTPSFTVNQEKGLFYCFGCQTGGDAFAFVMKLEGLSFNEAAEKLAQRAGVEWKPRASLSKDETERQEIKRALEFARSFYHKTLLTAPGAARAREYLSKRGLKPETVEKFALGFAPDSSDFFTQAAQRSGYREETLLRAGLTGRNDTGRVWDYFRGRVLFPIQNHRGEMSGFGGRVLGDGEPKYLNSPETPVFSKSRVLFGISHAGPAIRKAGRALVLEGYMDVIACHQFGVNTAVAPLGTALGLEHARIIKRYCESALLLFDPDTAGIRAALKGAQILTEAGLFVKVGSLPEGLDPDEYLLKYGEEKFAAQLDAAQDAIAFHAQILLSGMKTPLSPQDKTRAADALMETVALHPDPIVRGEWTKFVTDRLGVSETTLTQRLSKKRAENAQPVSRFAAKTAAPPPPEPEIPANERDLVRFSLYSPCAVKLAQNLEEREFVSARAFALLRGIMKLVSEGAAEQSVAAALAERMPECAGLVARLATEPAPKSFEPERDMADCARNVRRLYLKRRYAQLTAQMKEFVRQGRDTSALGAEQCAIVESGRNL